MIAHDISSSDALRLLTAPDDARSTLDRRRFLQLIGMGVGAGLAVNAVEGLLPGRVREAWALTPVGPHDGIVVLLGMFGGVDGLNVVVPYTDPYYYQQHGAIAIPGSKTLHLNTSVGLHPNLRYLKSLYDRKQVAVLQNVGYPNPDESHFNSMAYWMSGRPNSTFLDTGWIGRWLDHHPSAGLFAAIGVGSGLPLHLIGSTTRGVSVPEWGGGFAASTDSNDMLMYDAIKAFAKVSAGQGAWHDTVATMMKNMVSVGQSVAPAFDRPLPDDDLEKKMIVAARLINADLGTRVLDVGFDGFDNHSGEPTDIGDRMMQLDRALKSFFTTLDDRFRSRVTIMTYSEFGRTSYSNDSQGTDHGSANNHFVIGAGVKGGLYGHQPVLKGLQRWDRPDFTTSSIDFRSMYASVIDGWMGGGSSTVLDNKAFKNLGLFVHGPGAGVASGAVPPSVVGDYVSLAPARLYDSRSSRLLPLGAGTTGEVQVLGKGGVPVRGVSAVALHVIAVGASERSHFTAWPTGAVRPDVANVSVPATRPQPALVVVKTGKSGRVNIANDLGTAHCVVDVVGYFRPAAANRLHTVAPFRVLDTQPAKAPIRAGGVRVVKVRGVHGVPANADSVVLNVTALSSSTATSVTVYPSGKPRPGFSTMNVTKGLGMPNLVIAKVGIDSKIDVYNAVGTVHVVVDVIGYLAPTTTTTGRFVSLAPGRVFEAPGMSASGSSPTAFSVVGTHGVPAAGAHAVLLNIAASNASDPTGITVWSNGAAKPSSANVIVLKGTDGSNLAIVRPGVVNQFKVANRAGTVDVAIDVVGYFTK